MLSKEGTNSFGHNFWKLHVPKEHCIEGLEVSIITDETGIRIGGQLITWADIFDAKEQARKYDSTIST